MPRNIFDISALNGAAPGLGLLAQSLAGGRRAQQQGFDAEANQQSRLAQTLASIQHSNASVGDLNAKAAQQRAETALLGQRPDQYVQQAALASGSDIPHVQAILDSLKTGQPATVPGVGPDPDGSVMRMPVASDMQSKISQALSRLAPLLTNAKDIPIQDWAKASDIYNEQDLGQGILNGSLDRNAVGGMRAALAAKPLYNSDSTGGVLDQYAGGYNTDNPIAKATIGLRNAQAGEASAKASQTRQAIEDGIKTGDIVVVTDNDGKTSLLNKRTGISRPATSADGVPLIGKSKEEKLKPIPPNVNAKIIEGQQGLANIDAAIAALEKNPGAVGASNLIPGAQTAKQMWASDDDIATRAQVANIGSLVLHDRSGAAVSASEFPRLAPFIPSTGDTKEAAVTKLRRMKEIAEGELGLFANTYSEDAGYKPSPILKPKAPVAPVGAPKPGKIIDGFRYKGGDPANQASWEAV